MGRRVLGGRFIKDCMPGFCTVHYSLTTLYKYLLPVFNESASLSSLSTLFFILKKASNPKATSKVSRVRFVEISEQTCTMDFEAAGKSRRVDCSSRSSASNRRAAKSVLQRPSFQETYRQQVSGTRSYVTFRLPNKGFHCAKPVSKFSN
jgi:hypothetical protein